MDNSGVFVLIAESVTSPLAVVPFNAVDSLDGISAANLLCEMLGGSGGTSIDVWAQTSFDKGLTWLDVAHFSFLTSAGKKSVVLNALASKGVTAYSALGSEGVNDGILGDQMRGVITSVGTYTNTSVALRLHAK